MKTKRFLILLALTFVVEVGLPFFIFAPRLLRAIAAGGFVFLQLIAGATMRHLGVGLVIPTYPLTPEGGIMPKVHNAYIDLNFTHTRFLALLVAIFRARPFIITTKRRSTTTTTSAL